MGKYHHPRSKTKIAFSLSGYVCYASDFYSGLYHDITIFKERIDKHLCVLVKKDGNLFEQDNMTVKVIEKSNYCGALANKGCTGACCYS